MTGNTETSRSGRKVLSASSLLADKFTGRLPPPQPPSSAKSRCTLAAYASEASHLAVAVARSFFRHPTCPSAEIHPDPPSQRPGHLLTHSATPRRCTQAL